MEATAASPAVTGLAAAGSAAAAAAAAARLRLLAPWRPPTSIAESISWPAGAVQKQFAYLHLNPAPVQIASANPDGLRGCCLLAARQRPELPRIPETSTKLQPGSVGAR